MTNESICKSKFYEAYPTGRIDLRQIEVTPEYVTAICKLYDDRTADETACLVSEIGIAERGDGIRLGECVTLAKDMAYEGAIARVVSENVRFMGTTVKQNVVASVAAKADIPAEPDKEESVTPDDPVTVEDAAPVGTVQKMELVASSLFPDDDEDKPNSKQPAETEAIQNARDTKITILGKYNPCNNLSAGEILDDHPEIIVEFGPIYSGPKEDQKKAMMALYPEAVRRCQSKDKAA
jgi:hypothetical protein